MAEPSQRWVELGDAPPLTPPVSDLLQSAGRARDCPPIAALRTLPHPSVPLDTSPGLGKCSMGIPEEARSPRFYSADVSLVLHV